MEIPRYLTEQEVSKLIRRAVQTLRNDRHYGRGLPFHKNGRSIVYKEEDVIQHMESRRIAPEG